MVTELTFARLQWQIREWTILCKRGVSSVNEISFTNFISARCDDFVHIRGAQGPGLVYVPVASLQVPLTSTHQLSRF